MIAAFLPTNPVVPHSHPSRNYFLHTWLLRTPQWIVYLHHLLQQVLCLVWWKQRILSWTCSVSARLTFSPFLERTKLYQCITATERMNDAKTWRLWSNTWCNFMNRDLSEVLPPSKGNPQQFQAKYLNKGHCYDNNVSIWAADDSIWHTLIYSIGSMNEHPVSLPLVCNLVCQTHLGHPSCKVPYCTSHCDKCAGSFLCVHGSNFMCKKLKEFCFILIIPEETGPVSGCLGSHAYSVPHSSASFLPCLGF